MNRTSCLFAILACSVSASAEEPVRLVVALEGGPLLVDLSLTLDGRPFEEGRQRLVDEALAQADTNGDGQPTWGEALLNPRFPYRFRTQGAQSVSTFDRDGDRNMSRSEANLLLERFGNGPALAIVSRPTASNSTRLTEILDTNADGRIDDDELQSAEARLKSLDVDDDDVLAMSELSGRTTNAGYLQVRQGGSGRVNSQRGSIAVRADEAAAVRKLLLDRYGERGVIVAGQWTAVPGLVRQLDTNGNGRIEDAELDGVRTAPAQLAVFVNVGDDTAPVGVRVIDVAAPVDRGEVVLGELANQRALRYSTTKLVLRTGTDRVRTDYTRTAETILQRADTDENGYVEKSELEGNQALQYYLQQFDLFDQNADDKVFADEIAAFYERQQAPRQTQVSLQTAELQPTLFDGLDVDGDRRLSLRELRGVGERFRALDANGDRRVVGDELSGEVTLAFGRSGSNAFGSAIQRALPGRATPVMAGVSNGPKWFIAMDHNADGDLTPREFLGTRAQFDEIDTNEDGFVDVDEANGIE